MPCCCSVSSLCVPRAIHTAIAAVTSKNRKVTATEAGAVQSATQGSSDDTNHHNIFCSWTMCIIHMNTANCARYPSTQKSAIMPAMFLSMPTGPKTPVCASTRGAIRKTHHRTRRTLSRRMFTVATVTDTIRDQAHSFQICLLAGVDVSVAKTTASQRAYTAPPPLSPQDTPSSYAASTRPFRTLSDPGHAA